MPKVEFKCHSDDILSASVQGLDHLNIDAVEDTKVGDRYCFSILSQEYEFSVVAVYSREGMWLLGVEPIKGKSLPDLVIAIDKGMNDYSPRLVIDLPAESIILSGDQKLELSKC